MQDHPRTRISKTAVLGLIAVCFAYIMTCSVHVVLCTSGAVAIDASGRELAGTHSPPFVFPFICVLMIPLSIMGGVALSACGLVATKRDPTLRGRVLAWGGLLLGGALGAYLVCGVVWMYVLWESWGHIP